jgi:hypothetical protein
MAGCCESQHSTETKTDLQKLMQECATTVLTALPLEEKRATQAYWISTLITARCLSHSSQAYKNIASPFELRKVQMMNEKHRLILSIHLHTCV